MKAYLGADWSATEVSCSVGVDSDRARRITGAKRTFADVKDLLDRVRARHPGVHELHVVIEAGAPGWVQMFHHAGAVVHVVDPKQAKAFSESLCSSGAKDDGRDADNLVSMGRSARHLPEAWVPDDERRAGLRELSGLHETLTRDLGAAQQRLRSHLRERFPTLEAVLNDLTRDWTIRLLRVIPTAWHAERVSEQELATSMAGARSASRSKVLEAIEAGHAPWLREGAAASQAVVVRSLVAQIELLARELSDVDARLDKLTADLDIRKQLETVGGIAQKMANRLIEFAFDSVPETRDTAGIQLGASPVFRGSGKTPKGKPKGKAAMRRAVAPRARSTGYLLGRLASQQLGWAKRMYAHARARGQDAAHAYRRIARSLLRILTAMARTGEPYDDARYLAALRAKGVEWACEPTAIDSAA